MLLDIYQHSLTFTSKVYQHGLNDSRHCYEPTDGPELSSSTIIRDASKIIVQSMKPVQVIEEGKKIGIVSSEDVLRLISGEKS